MSKLVALQPEVSAVLGKLESSWTIKNIDFKNGESVTPNTALSYTWCWTKEARRDTILQDGLLDVWMKNTNDTIKKFLNMMVIHKDQWRSFYSKGPAFTDTDLKHIINYITTLFNQCGDASAHSDGKSRTLPSFDSFLPSCSFYPHCHT